MKVILKKDLNSPQHFLHVEIPFLSLLCHLCAQKQQSLSTRRCSVVVLMLVSNTCAIHVFCSVCVNPCVCVCVCVLTLEPFTQRAVCFNPLLSCNAPPSPILRFLDASQRPQQQRRRVMNAKRSSCALTVPTICSVLTLVC